MCDPITLMVGGGLALSAIGLGTSYEASRSAASRQQDQWNEQQRQIQKSEEEAQRKYEADVKNYDTAMGVYGSNVNYLNKLIADPTMHPDYASAKETLTSQLKGARETLKSTLQRRGRTGGLQDKLLKDLEASYEAKMETLVTDIQNKARVQKLSLMKPNQPYLGQGEINWAPYMQQVGVSTGTDLSGFGEILALAGAKKSTENSTDSTLLKSGESLAPYGAGFSYQDMMDWATTEW